MYQTVLFIEVRVLVIRALLREHCLKL